MFDEYDAALHMMAMTQFGVREGLRRFGDKGRDAVQVEIQQLHNMGVITPIHATPEQRKQALQYLMFLKEKRSGKIKGRGCADGRPQRQTMTKVEALSPTPQTNTVIITCIWDAKEGRYVAVVNIPGRSSKPTKKVMSI